MSKKYTLLTFKGICMNFLLELKFFILSHPLTSKQPRKIVQIHMHHPVVLKLFPIYMVSHTTVFLILQNQCYPGTSCIQDSHWVSESSLVWTALSSNTIFRRCSWISSCFSPSGIELSSIFSPSLLSSWTDLNLQARMYMALVDL